jgi:hypothetical protein
LSYMWVQQALLGAGLVAKSRGAASTGDAESGVR